MTVNHRSPRRRARLPGNRQWLFVAALAFAATFARTNPAQAVDLANSFNDWSFSGNQGENDWFYGYRNFTLDGGGAYDYLNHFIPFFNDGTNVISPTNQWTGDHWRLEANPGGTGGPWTELLRENTHPNGTNSQPLQEHWTMRRWVANSLAAPTELALEWQMRKTNTGGGNGVGGFLFLNGVQLDTATIAGNDGVGVLRTAVTTVNPGDVIDLALTPNGSDGSDGSAFRLRITDELPPPPPAPPIADSLADWSATGTQGENSWFNGYRNYTVDGGGPYDFNNHFIAFQNDGTNVISPTNQWAGNHWRLEGNPGATGGPWTELFSENTHPNGTNSQPLQEHWTMRRWVADVTEPTPLALNWLMRKTNPNGTGVEGRLFINGVEVDAAAIAGNDSTGLNRKYYANIYPGDVVDLALGPTGPTGDRTDGADGSANRLIIDPNIPANAYNRGAKVADSVAQWSTTGTQGENNWFNGYYERRGDANDTYDDVDFVAFLNDGTNVVANAVPPGDPGYWTNSSNHWDGGKYDLANNGNGGRGPWTEISQGGGHPAANGQGTPEVHSLVRRWVADVGPEGGTFEIMATFNTPAPCGDGTTGSIYVNGVELFSAVTQGNTQTGTVIVDLNDGDVVDILVDPNGSFNATDINAINDGCDSTNFSAMVTEIHPFQPVPEPSSVVLMLLGAAGLGAVAYRRRP
ncbi:MAG: hypothetical protein DCC68_20425 [Planctomycetota bacterium]|nr:MAG: hypothetical protein DCC68_20425 [Planctomycetota bacterium]